MDENTQTINTDVKTQDFQAPGTTNIPGIGFNFSGLTNVPETKPIALDKIDTPVQDVSKIQQDIADSATITPGNLDTNVGAITQGGDIEIPDEQPIVEEQKELTMRELVEQRYRNQVAGIGGVDPIAETKRGLTENSGLIEQRTLARDIQQDMRTRQLDFQDAKNELTNNPTSSSRGVVNARVNDLTAKYQDRRARDLLQFSVANGNALEAEAVITERIAELNDQRDREDKLFDRMFAFSQDNMSESEKQEALDRRAERSFEMDKELIDYKASLSGSSAPTIKNINGVDMQWNPTTGKFESIGTGSDEEETTKAKGQLSFLRDSAQQALELAGSSGKGLIDRLSGAVLGSSKFNQLETLTDTLKTNILTLSTDPSIKKFFGPQMSEADVRLMTAAGTTLRPASQTPDQLKGEIGRLDNLFNRMQTAITEGESGVTSGAEANTITAPDGTLVIITD